MPNGQNFIHKTQQYLISEKLQNKGIKCITENATCSSGPKDADVFLQPDAIIIPRTDVQSLLS
jgi:hypothetical protein